MLGTPNVIEIGHDHRMKFFRWSPDRELNLQYQDQPDIEKMGALRHKVRYSQHDCSRYPDTLQRKSERAG